MAVPPDQQRPSGQQRRPDHQGPTEEQRPPGKRPATEATDQPRPADGGRERPPTGENAPDRTRATGDTAAAPARAPAEMVIRPTRISGTWIAVVVAAVVLIFLLIFILQNLSSVTVVLLGLEATVPLGIALLFAAIAGALLVALVGTARILQLRRRVRRSDANLLKG